MDAKKQCLPDRLIYLPEKVLENIFARLPLKEAAKTSILSTKWRTRWIDVSKLKFDYTFRNLSVDKLFKTIYHVLLTVSHPISSFTLSVPGLKSCPDIDHLLFFLSKHLIDELTLIIDVRKAKYHRLPSYLFSFVHLHFLKLSGFVLPVPDTFQGFDSLLTICLENVDFGVLKIANILNLCPSLEILVIRYCLHCEDLAMGAPKLKEFVFESELKTASFLLLPVLTLFDVCNTSAADVCVDDAVGFLTHVPMVEHLHLIGVCLNLGDYGSVPAKLPVTLDCLKCLDLSDLSQDLGVLSKVLCLMISSPNLQWLTIGFKGAGDDVDDIDNACNGPDLSGSTFDRLQLVHLRDFQDSKIGMGFAKLILAKSPELQKFHIEASKQMSSLEDRYKILLGLTQFGRASPYASIMFEGSSTGSA